MVPGQPIPGLPDPGIWSTNARSTSPVLDGLFLYLAVTALHCNQLFERIMLLVTEQVRRFLLVS